MKVNEVHILLSCISEGPVMHACEDRHDLIWRFSFLYNWSAYLHLFSNMENINRDNTDMI
jgi:hypothetical protein